VNQLKSSTAVGGSLSATFPEMFTNKARFAAWRIDTFIGGLAMCAKTYVSNMDNSAALCSIISCIISRTTLSEEIA
jgi:hypothetical protein